jgi:hypothetical protein
MRIVSLIYHQFSNQRDHLRPFFQWQYSGWFIATAVGIFFATLLVGQYRVAYISIIAGCIVSIGYWLTSEMLNRARRELSSRTIRRNAELSHQKWLKYIVIEWGGVVLIIMFIVLGCFYIEHIKWEQISSSVRNTLLIDISVPPGHSPLSSQITATNNSDRILTSKHRIACQIVLAVGNGNTAIDSSPNVWAWINGEQWTIDLTGRALDQNKIPNLSPLQPSGDGISESCLGGLHFPTGTQCADIRVLFQYFIDGYPDRLQTKQARFVAKDNGTGVLEWHKQPFKTHESYCVAFLQKTF